MIFREELSIVRYSIVGWLVQEYSITRKKEEGVVRRLHGLRMSTVVHVCVKKA
jgi:hypothetical protein